MADQIEARRKARAATWGRYVATAPIHIHGALAFRKGDPVPVGHVERGLVTENQVEDRQAKTSNTKKEG